MGIGNLKRGYSSKEKLPVVSSYQNLKPKLLYICLRRHDDSWIQLLIQGDSLRGRQVLRRIKLFLAEAFLNFFSNSIVSFSKLFKNILLLIIKNMNLKYHTSDMQMTLP